MRRLLPARSDRRPTTKARKKRAPERGRNAPGPSTSQELAVDASTVAMLAAAQTTPARVPISAATSATGRTYIVLSEAGGAWTSRSAAVTPANSTAASPSTVSRPSP